MVMMCTLLWIIARQMGLSSGIRLVQVAFHSPGIIQGVLYNKLSSNHKEHQAPIVHPNQIPRQIPPQMQQIINSQNLASQSIAFQQQKQWERMRRRQQSTPCPGVNMDKERPMVQVKIEAPSDFPMDNNAFSEINARQSQLQQLCQQQLAAMSTLQARAGNQYRPMSSLQVSQMQVANMGMIRAPPVKVEGLRN